MENDNLFEKRQQTEEKTVFTRYNREERLKKASPEVRSMYDGSFIERKGLIKSLTANRGSRAVFFIIILLIVLNLVLFAFFKDRSSGKIAKVKVEVQTFVYDGSPLANLKLYANPEFLKQDKNKKDNKANKNSSTDNTGEPVKVQFSFFDKDKNKLSSTIKTGIYTGADLSFSDRDETGKAKSVEVNILMKEKILKLTKKINE